MKVGGRSYRTIWLNADGWGVDVIDQRWLPHEFRVATLRSVADAATAIRDMWVRERPAHRGGGGLRPGPRHARQCKRRRAGRGLGGAPRDAADRDQPALGARRRPQRPAPLPPSQRAAAAYAQAAEIADEDVAINRAMGRNGFEIIRRIAETKKPGEPVNILTHCNAGWLATVDYGTATAPICLSIEEGLPVHVYVDETRPRNQGASLTAWELVNQGAPHTLVVDNAGGHLMQHGLVDMVLVGSDRTTANGDVCNKIGTYLKALRRATTGAFRRRPASPTILSWTVRDWRRGSRSRSGRRRGSRSSQGGKEWKGRGCAFGLKGPAPPIRPSTSRRPAS